MDQALNDKIYKTAKRIIDTAVLDSFSDDEEYQSLIQQYPEAFAVFGISMPVD